MRLSSEILSKRLTEWQEGGDTRVDLSVRLLYLNGQHYCQQLCKHLLIVWELKCLYSLCLPIMNHWTRAYASCIYSAFQQLCVSMAGSQTLKHGWVSAWMKVERIEFDFFYFFYSSPWVSLKSGWALWWKGIFQTVEDCLLVMRSCSAARHILYS